MHYISAKTKSTNCFPANTVHWPNAGLMLARRLRRRPNVNPALGQCIVFAGLLYKYAVLLTSH